MNITRSIHIPFNQILAEMASFPLASTESLMLKPSPLIALDSDLKNVNSKEFWRLAEKKFLQQFPDLSIDEMVYARDLLWFHDENYNVIHAPINLSDYLYHLSSRCLKIEGNTARPDIFRYFRLKNSYQSTLTEKNQSRTFWRWLNLSLPSDLLLAGLSLKKSIPAKIETLSPLLWRLLKDKNYAELHLHLGAALDFPLFWIFAQKVIADAETQPDFLESPGAQLNEGKDFGYWLIHCILVRYVLALFLSRRRNNSLSEYFQADFQPKYRNSFGLCNYVLLSKAIYGFSCGMIEDMSICNFRALQRIFASLTGILAKKVPSDLNQMYAYDPVSFLLSGHMKPDISSEICWLTTSLSYIDSSPDDLFFSSLFWQVVRVRCLLYRHIVQRPMTPGLQWFFRFYERIRSIRKAIPTQILVKKAFQLSGRELGLKSLEVRGALTNNYIDILKGVKDAAHAAQSVNPKLEFGVVFHITRDRGGGARKGIQPPQGKKAFADPTPDMVSTDGNLLGFRYSRYYRKKRSEILALGKIFRHFPYYFNYIRGIDLCSDETGVPHWVVVPLFNYIRESGEIASKLLSEYTGQTLPALRTTIHIGEDYTHLLGGLRRVDQAVDFLDLKEGDRIGHALTLGVDPMEWAQRKRYVLLPREERLLDLVWEWYWYANNGDQAEHQRIIYLNKEISRLSEMIFRKSLPVYKLYEFINALHEEKTLRACGFPDRIVDTKPTETTEKLVYQYLTDPALFQRGTQLELVETTTEGTILENLQHRLRCKIAKLGITVELNPSSNLLIGNFGDLERHPFWRLHPPKNSSDNCISVVIGSDDPLIFATDLPNEYQFLRDTLINAGVSDDQTMNWLESIRNKGLESRFTLETQREDVSLSLMKNIPVFSNQKVTLPP